MKIRLNQEAGGVLVITLILSVIFGVTLASYLDLVSNQNLSIARSQQWNAAIPVAEAGIEEALAHLNRNFTNRTVDGWTLDGTNVWKERFIGENKYRVFINAFVDPPLVLAEGYVKIPKTDEFIMPPRIIRVGTTNDALFAKGMVAKGQIDLAGNNIMTDSFDSSDTNYSTGGRYDPAKRKDNGDVATNSSLIDSLNVWNADIYGSASTGPGGTVRIGKNGSIGDLAWHAAGNQGIQPGRARDDMNVDFPDVYPPFSGGAFTPVGGNIDGTNYTYILASGNYQLSSLNLSGGQKVLVAGDAVLYVTGNVSLSGNSLIQIEAGSSLNMFVGGSTTSFGGNGVVNNNASAMHFSYWGLNSNTSVKLHGNASFTGTLYAPHASLTLGGGGSDTYDFVGAAVADSVKMNGHYNFHYDEAIGKFGPRRGYTVISWSETSGWEEL